MTRRTPALALMLLISVPLVCGCKVAEAVGLRDKPPEVSVEELYDEARALFQAEEWSDAEDIFGDLWRDHPDAALGPDARFYEAECRYGRGKFDGAFELYKTFLDAHPYSPHIPLVQRRLYDMGTYTIEEGKHGLFGLSYSDQGVAMLDYLVSAFPHGDLADDALVYAADHEWQMGKHLRAIGHLHDLLDFYPGSEWTLEGRLRLARAYRDVNRGTLYDGDALDRSKAQYLAYIDIVSSDSAREREYHDLLEQARRELASVEERIAQKMLAAADYYARTGKDEAADAELRNLIREHPGTSAAATARERLGQLDQLDRKAGDGGTR